MTIHRFQTLPSTNDEAMRLAREGAPAGQCVVADEQTAGRGRAGHSWTSPPGVALYFSVILRPRVAPERLPPVDVRDLRRPREARGACAEVAP